MLLLTWTINYKLTTARLDTELKEIADSTATGAEAAQACEDLARKDRRRGLQQITTAQMRIRERCYSEAHHCSYLCAHIQ